MILYKAVIDKCRDSHTDFKVIKSRMISARLFDSLCATAPTEYPAFFVDRHGAATCRPLFNIRPSVGDLTSYVCVEVSELPKLGNCLNQLCSFSHMEVFVRGLLTKVAQPLMKWLLSSYHTSNYCSNMESFSFLGKLFKRSVDTCSTPLHSCHTVHFSVILINHSSSADSIAFEGNNKVPTMNDFNKVSHRLLSYMGLNNVLSAVYLLNSTDSVLSILGSSSLITYERNAMVSVICSKIIGTE